MSNIQRGILILIGLLVFVVASTVYTVKEGQHALKLKLGKLVEDADGNPMVYTPGLHFKIPVLHTVRVFDTRIQTLDIQSSRIVTEEKKDVLVDYYVKWRVIDLARYFTRTSGDARQAETLLAQQINDGLRAQFGRRNITDVVSGERADVMESVQQQADRSAKNLGIDIVDVRIKAIDLPKEVSMAVYERMRTERQRIANQHRADGRSRAEAIRANADKNVAVIAATAESAALKVRGEADAETARIYAEAYQQDPEFFAFYRSLAAYKSVFANKDDILVLRPDSEFFKYFNQAGSKADS